MLVQGELLRMFCVNWLEARTVSWSLTVSTQEKDLGDRVGYAKPEVLKRQEFIPHPLENPSQNTCDLQTGCVLS